ncbi:NAD(P)-binding Rossmann-fold superfamily protein isoform 6 [Theobroma cacao]|uniref:NAD(P)-binding Rossmann-fold superfamily protein isoform 6 n=1 Tax=Theobroma cacao TaxID=3641 RepID=A0A061E0H7_THECC|nr:NAD(P)-binding Rossmann-fold superfamily protein isoform 6 [Theobroma cacao]
MMESCCLQSPAITTVPSSLPRSGFIEKPLGYGRVFKLPRCKKYPLSRKLKVFDFRAQASGTTKTNSEVAGAISNKADSKDEDLAFVAGATGRVGSRTVRELLKLGFQVRAGVRSAQKAETLVQSVKQMKLNSEGTTPVEKLEIVEYDLEKQDTIAPALGNASVVICCIGAGEKEVFDITGPYRIDYQATQNLIHAATVAKVNHFILVSSLGTNKVGFPAAILNLFWGVLIWKRKAEEALIASGLPYTSDQEEWSGPLMLSRKLIILPSLLKILYLVAWCQIFRWQNSWHAWPKTAAFPTVRWWKSVQKELLH